MTKKEDNQIKDFTDLRAWQLANEIRRSVYTLSDKLPKTEEYNLKSQIRRASLSVASNIAEGYGRFSFQENTQFCRQARGSLEETRDQLMFISEIYDNLKEDCDKVLVNCLECKKTLNGYINYLQKKRNSS